MCNFFGPITYCKARITTHHQCVASECDPHLCILPGGRDPGRPSLGLGLNPSHAAAAPGTFASGAAAGIQSPTGADAGPGIEPGKTMGTVLTTLTTVLARMAHLQLHLPLLQRHLLHPT